MKEATGELNMTVVTIVAIAALVAFFYLIIWPNIQVGMTLTSACNSAGGSDMEFKDANGNTVTVCKDGICTYTDPESQAQTQKVCD